MIRAETWAGLLNEAGYTLATGVPCSSLAPLQNYFQATNRFTYVAAPNEGQAVAVAAGAIMAGRRAVVLMQNSGLGNAINPLTSLVEVFQLPLMLITSWRGQPGRPDEPQHMRMGLSTHAVLDAIGIPHTTLATEGTEAMRQLHWAIGLAERGRRCVAIVVPDGVFDATHAPAEAPATCAPGIPEDLTCGAPMMSRTDALKVVCMQAGPDTIRLATTGKTGRELFAVADDPRNLYVVGSMGLASSVGLGLSLALPRPILVIDGDGAALMHLGALPMIARYGGKTLMHVVLDNGAYDSTGGQRSISTHAPFSEIAAKCGYAYAARVDNAAGLASAMGGAACGPALIHVLLRSGSPPHLPRPSRAPPETLKRLQHHFGIHAA